MATYTITKGQQYDREGARVAWSLLGANYTRAGDHENGNLPAARHLETIEQAIGRVIATGATEIVTIHEQLGSTVPDETIACDLYIPSDGCPLHGELCAPEDS